jgi:hypothetical protein
VTPRRRPRRRAQVDPEVRVHFVDLLELLGVLDRVKEDER